MSSLPTARIRSRVPVWLGRLILCGMLLGAMLPAVAQDAAPAVPAAEGGASTAPTKKKKSMLERLEEGGWVMFPILGFSVLTVWLSVDLWIRTGKKKVAPESHVNGVKDLFRLGDYVGAYQYAKSNPSAFSDSTRVALSFVGDGQMATEDVMIGELNKFNAATTTRINYLSVIGVCTPMVGLLGTVTGMITAFDHMGQDGVSNPAGLSAAIGHVLMATAAGLAIAIPAFMMFYVLRNRLQGSLHHAQDIVVSLFRKMPYEDLQDCHVGEEEFFAARPNWIGDDAASPARALPA